MGQNAESSQRFHGSLWSWFTDYDWYSSLTAHGIKFVTRLKTNAKIKVLNKRRGRRSPGVRQDATIQLGDIPEPLRMIVYYDEESDKEYQFVSNAHDLTAQTITDLYKERWQVETFFKWIKGNLRVKSFLGTSRNAVLAQIWIALIVYLLLAFLTFKSKLRISMQQMLRVLQLNLFERRYFTKLFKPPEPQLTVSPQTSMLDYLWDSCDIILKKISKWRFHRYLLCFRKGLFNAQQSGFGIKEFSSISKSQAKWSQCLQNNRDYQEWEHTNAYELKLRTMAKTHN
jgi:hypothetical protein